LLLEFQQLATGTGQIAKPAREFALSQVAIFCRFADCYLEKDEEQNVVLKGKQPQRNRRLLHRSWRVEHH
jgi:hypothetical protein